MDIWVDIDDTIACTDEKMMDAARLFHTETLHRSLPREKPEPNSSEDYFYFARWLDWDVKDVTQFFHAVYPDILSYVEPKEGVREAFDHLRSRGYRIHLLSARRDSEYNGKSSIVTSAWLHRYRLKVDSVILDCTDKPAFLSDKHGIYIDDSFHDCMEAGNLKEIRAIQFASTHGRTCHGNNVERVNCWQDILGLLAP